MSPIRTGIVGLMVDWLLMPGVSTSCVSEFKDMPELRCMVIEQGGEVREFNQLGFNTLAPCAKVSWYRTGTL